MIDYEQKRKNFKEQAFKHFAFLVDDFGYSPPIFEQSQQENGTITSDSIVYENLKSNKVIAVENNYHPNDYGFEVIYWDSLSQTPPSSVQMIAHCLKENQDVEQLYVKNIAEAIKVEFKKLLI